MVGEEKRHQMMQNLFGDQSEEEEEEVESEHESNPQPNYASDEGDGEVEPEAEGEGEGEAEGPGEVEVESEGELHDDENDDVEPANGESEGEREQSSQEVEVEDQREESEGKESESDEKEERGPIVTSRRRDVVESGSERSDDNRYADNGDDEVDQAGSQSHRSPDEEEGEAHIPQSAPEIRDVFGESDDEEPPEYAVQNHVEDESNRSPMDDEGSYEKDLRPEDMLADEEGRYESEEDNMESKFKEKPVGPPLELEIPLQPPPAHPEKMNMIKVSNIMGVDSKEFNPKTYVEEDILVTDESGSQKRIRLDNNIVRWRAVRRFDGSTSLESNARFVRWSDGSLQLLIGNEVLDISVQDAQHDQAHLFLRHGKGILQSQGRLLRKMRFMPSSLTSNSHRLLTALVDSRHKKVYKVKNCVTDIDPEREKEQKERAESQNIRANELLSRKKEKVRSKYTQSTRRERQLSPGFLEDALEEDEEDDYGSRRRRFDEVEARAEKRMINAKKGYRDIPRKSSFSGGKSSARSNKYSDGEEESEYENDDEEEEEEIPEDEDEEPEAEDTSEEEPEERPPKGRDAHGSMKRKEIESDEDSPPRKATTAQRRRVVYDDSDDD
jgi:RNA polymerase-associated protein LEO1